MENQTKTTLTLNPEEEKQSNTLLEGVPVRKTEVFDKAAFKKNEGGLYSKYVIKGAAKG